MDTESFGYSLLAKTNGVVETRVITVGAALDVDSYVQFAPDLEWTPKCRCEIIIDCAALKIVSTVGLGFFLLVDAHARKHFGHARIVNCNEDVARVLQTATDFTSRFRMPFERAAAK